MLLWWAELGKTLICLLVVWPEATQHWSIPGSLVGLMADSGRAHTKEYFPELVLPVSLSPGEPQLPPASAGDPPTLAGRSGSVSYESLLLPLGPDVRTALCVPSKSGTSVSPSPVEVLQSNPTSLQSLIL